jgi:aldehyde dehydrogenase (NAD+)
MENMKKLFKDLEIGKINPCSSNGLVHDYSDDIKFIKSPIDNQVLSSVCMADRNHYEKIIGDAKKAFNIWRSIPAPKRGEIVRQIGDELRKNKESLGMLVSMETGKILQEGLGEVQEMIDICDFAVGLSRQLNGLTMHSERPEHRMYEQWHPLGIVGIISAFNFPVAVWAWNAMIAAVCGNVCVWKPSEKTPLTAIACQNIVKYVINKNNLPAGIFCLINGDYKIGELISNDNRIPLVSATGSTRMGRIVGKAVAERFGKTILELGGNNAVIISDKADLNLAIRAVAFGAVGTCGQRCTSTRRLIVHESVYNEVKSRLVNVYKNITIGSPLDSSTLVGPLIDSDAVKSFKDAITKAEVEGGTVVIGGRHLYDNYVYPAIIEAENDYEIVQEETFAPILYLIKYSGDIMNAISIQNDVKQGLSSSLFTTDIRESELFLSAWGSDCGIANVNIGTSGAECHSAFGGEKETGGGREAGTESWKSYMRRQTNVINYSKELPLAQGIKFDI